MENQPVPNIPDPIAVADAGHFFRYMAEFVGFDENDANAIRASALLVEKNLPEIIGKFYTNLLQHPHTRKFFTRPDGSVDEDYLKLRMYHQANFWRKTAGGVYDDEYAHFVDYVGRSHTSHGADPRLFIPERYVIGMVGFVQHAIVDAIIKDLNGYNPELEQGAIKAWTKLCIVILEMLARAYGIQRDPEQQSGLMTVDPQEMLDFSIESYEKSLNLRRRYAFRTVVLGPEEMIPDGERKIIEVDGASIGVFHHKGQWYALRNKCLHRGGPVAAGKLVDDHIICPWHGYTYNVTTGRLLVDPSARLEQYAVTVEDGQICLQVPEPDEIPEAVEVATTVPLSPEPNGSLAENEFYIRDLPPGQIKLVHLNGERVAVYNVDGNIYATAEECTHAGGPLSEGELDGQVVICPWHYSCFDVTNGDVKCKPAKLPVKTYPVPMTISAGCMAVCVSQRLLSKRRLNS